MNKILKFVLLNLGCAIAVLPAVFLFSRTTTPPGGIYSLAMVASNALGWGSNSDTVGNIALILNVPLLFLALAVFGLEYLLKVVYASVAYPL